MRSQLAQSLTFQGPLSSGRKHSLSSDPSSAHPDSSFHSPRAKVGGAVSCLLCPSPADTSSSPGVGEGVGWGFYSKVVSTLCEKLNRCLQLVSPPLMAPEWRKKQNGPPSCWQEPAMPPPAAHLVPLELNAMEAQRHLLTPQPRCQHYPTRQS